MASVEECDSAVSELAARLEEVDPQLRSRYAASRTFRCRVSDLSVAFVGRLSEDGQLVVRRVDAQHRGDEQVTLTVSSDDLVALAEGRLAVPTAYATGRLKVDANVLDLLRLRSLL